MRRFGLASKAARGGGNRRVLAFANPGLLTDARATPHRHRGRPLMLHRTSIGAAALIAALTITAPAARAFDDSRYPDWSGVWRYSGPNKWDPGKPPGRGQQAPLTPEYQAVLEASLADQAQGGPGNDFRHTCIPTGMPRMMTAIFAFEFAILPNVTYMLFESAMPRRIHTNGRDWPKTIEPAFTGYSIGKWIDEDGDGRYDLLEIETRGFKGPRNYDPTGIPLHSDNQTVIRERMRLDKANPNALLNEITTIDNALARPWTVNKTYRRQRNHVWLEYECNENNPHVVIGGQTYMLSADGHLMPQKKGQPPPDLRYFPQTQK